MEEEIVKIDGVELVLRAMMQESEALEKELDADEHQKAYNNLIAGMKVLVEMQKVDNEFYNNENNRELEKSISEAKIEIEQKKLELENAEHEINAARIELDREIENNRKEDSKIRKYLDIGGLGVSVVGLIFGTALTMKTLKVNLDAVITDRDAVQSAKKIFDHFAFIRK